MQVSTVPPGVFSHCITRFMGRKAHSLETCRSCRRCWQSASDFVIQVSSGYLISRRRWSRSRNKSDSSVRRNPSAGASADRAVRNPFHTLYRRVPNALAKRSMFSREGHLLARRRPFNVCGVQNLPHSIEKEDIKRRQKPWLSQGFFV